MADLLKAGKLPELGDILWEVYPIPWGDIKSVEQLDRDVKDAERSVQLARQMGIEQFVQESLVIQGYMQAIKALWELKHLVKPEGVSETDKPAARSHFAAYLAGMKQANNALTAWEASIERPGKYQYANTAVKTVTEMIHEMETTAKDLGCLP
jgi:hypothetical protein